MNGKGTVYQRSEDGGWRGRLPVGFTEDGKPEYRWASGRTKVEADEKIEDLRRQRDAGVDISNRVGVDELARRWLENKASRVSGRTLELYTDYIGRSLRQLGRMEVAKVGPIHVEAVVDRVARESGAATANKVRRVLFGMFKHAVRLRIIPNNPVDGVDPLKETPHDVVLWTHEEASRFLAVATPHRLFALFHLAIAAGLRKGEIEALRWSDIEHGKIIVTRTVTRVGGEIRFAPPKTKNGRRVVNLSEETICVLQAHRTRQDLEATVAGPGFNQDDLVFCNVEGNLITPMALHHVFRRLQNAAGVPTARFHDLRHLSISLLIEHGVNPEVVADRVGHKDGAYTLARYTHVFEVSRRGATVGLADLLKPRGPLN